MPTVTISLPTDAAVDLLVKFGWTHDTRNWISPGGERYWQTDEAVTAALLSEVGAEWMVQ